ncbi:MAG TPA: NapC/NirT family cytochrome c [Candidatus Acidoferrales bacterium]|nr:NapC/NirT family cytochrome c [Candidatus Acidoferrales bacterium]
MADVKIGGSEPLGEKSVPNWERDRPGIILLTSHWLIWAGLGLAITAISTWLFVEPAEVGGHAENPYKGVVLYLILPLVLVGGLALAGLGLVLGRRRIRERMTIGVNDRRTALQRLIGFLVIVIGFNIVFGTQLTYRAVEYMDTPQFCGATCHVMRPEFVGHQDSAHASVACAECHIAPGAGGWIDAKMNGARQVWETITNSYRRPVPSALESGRLVPSKETCERCHWAEKIVATRLLLIPSYAPDEHNTDTYTVLMMLVGGSKMQGIHHAHFAGGFEVRYAAADPKRQTIPWVERRDTRTGKTMTYLAAGTTAEQAAALPQYAMQCVDCHDRPTHGFWLPDRALDRALALGQLPATLPFIKKQGRTVLEATYASGAEAAQKIPAAIEDYYRSNYPLIYNERRNDVLQAASAVLAIYNRNVFPELNVTWGTYPNNLGHIDSPGCFRCHDGQHTTADGTQSIKQDCDSCHQLLAADESSPEILKTLGLWDRIEALKRH